jgi:hypothetical protein
MFLLIHLVVFSNKPICLNYKAIRKYSYRYWWQEWQEKRVFFGFKNIFLRIPQIAEFLKFNFQNGKKVIFPATPATK